MLPTGRHLQQLAAESGFEVTSLEKVLRLSEVISGISQMADLARSLVLKGGTALNLFYGPPSRLSVDLDFNFVGAEGSEELAALRPDFEHRLQALARSQGFGVQRSRDSHGGRKFFLAYARVTDGQPDRIEIDVNYLHRVTLLSTEQRQMWRPDSEGPLTTLLSWPEIAAGKLVAFLDRCAPRDAWDVARLPLLSQSVGPWPPPVLRGLFVALAGTLPKPLHEYGRIRLDRVRDSDVSRLLWPTLIGSERPTADWLREASWSVVMPFLDLSEAEVEFCDRLQRGDLCPELLSLESPSMLDRVRHHPALLWKAQNARVHAGRARRR